MFPLRFSRFQFLFLICIALTISMSAPTYATGVGISVSPDTAVSSTSRTDILFNRYRVPSSIDPFARRDLEFLWSSTYVTRNQKPLNPNDGNDNDLDRLGKAMCFDQSNPFGFIRTDVKLITDYLNFAGTLYNNTNPAESSPFLVEMSAAPSC